MTWDVAYIAITLGAGLCLTAAGLLLAPPEEELWEVPSRATKTRWALSDVCAILGACSVTVAAIMGLVEIVERIGGA